MKLTREEFIEYAKMIGTVLLLLGVGIFGAYILAAGR